MEGPRRGDGLEEEVGRLRESLQRAEQKNALLERNQKMLHERMANIDQLIARFAALDRQLKKKSQQLAHNDHTIHLLQLQRTPVPPRQI